MPEHAVQTDRGRFYDWQGTRFPSVTTALSALAKPALVGWGIKSVAEGAVKHADELNLRLLTDGQEPTVRWLKGLPYSERDKAADLGSECHKAAELHTLGAPQPPWPLNIAPFMRQFQLFLDAYHPEYLMAEASVYSPKHGYAGTLDFIARIGDRVLLGDIKTGASGPWPEAALQLAAYSRADFVGMPDGSEQPLPALDGAVVLKLRPDHFQLLEVDISDATFDTFLSVLHSWRWQQTGAPTAIRELVLPQAVAS